MEYVYAALILNEANVEINEHNVTNVLEAAGVSVEESRVKALIAALEDVNIDEAVANAAAAPAAAGAAGGAAVADQAAGEPEEPIEEKSDVPDTTDDDDDEASGEGLGELFG